MVVEYEKLEVLEVGEATGECGGGEIIEGGEVTGGDRGRDDVGARETGGDETGGKEVGADAGIEGWEEGGATDMGMEDVGREIGGWLLGGGETEVEDASWEGGAVDTGSVANDDGVDSAEGVFGFGLGSGRTNHS
jgi:hypothetical protein